MNVKQRIMTAIRQSRIKKIESLEAEARRELAAVSRKLNRLIEDKARLTGNQA